MRFAGEFAALGTALCWATGSNLFAAAGRRMGSVVLNRLRITVAAAFLCTALLAFRGSPWPTWASGSQIALLAASGLVGFALTCLTARLAVEPLGTAAGLSLALAVSIGCNMAFWWLRRARA